MKQLLKGMFLHEIDIRFIKYLHAMKVATYAQATRDIYLGYHQDSVGKRIRKMESNKLLQSSRARVLLNGKCVVHLSKKGFLQFVRRGDEQRVELKSDSVAHDLTLVDLRNAFLKSKQVKRYLSENELQTWGHSLCDAAYSSFVNLNSDAVVDIQFTKGILRVPVEYEAHQKSDERYEKVLNKYYNSDETEVVLFVCGSSQIMNKVIGLEKLKYKVEQPKFFYSLADNILKNGSMSFINCRDILLTLDA
ncbi:MAG: hypothetical protein HOO06_09620 [Bdellovibrionaceae bacterium]|jgi:hypothetical protein|nr:hypothetical protein [Pseudobdellovibrionaceae bacterium]